MQDDNKIPAGEIDERLQIIGLSRINTPWYCKIHLIPKLLLGNYKVSRKYGCEILRSIRLSFKYTVLFTHAKLALRIFKGETFRS